MTELGPPKKVLHKLFVVGRNAVVFVTMGGTSMAK